MAEGELRAARRIARAAAVKEHRFLPMPRLMELSDMEPTPMLAGLPPTYIPMKNAIFYSLAAAFAEETGASRIVGGHNRDDLRSFEDTSDGFFTQLQRAMRAGSTRLRERRVTIWRPLRKLSKVEVVSLANTLGVPLEMTWSCHLEGKNHCWKCVGCATRIRTFAAAGVVDPLRPKTTENV
jgi:7-cyano-7-deazaguanine synthase